jgi:outer membrane immunogenic protein
MRKLLMVGAALIVLAVGAAHAADLAVRQPVYRAPAAAAPGFTWTGIYIGGNGGCGADKKDYVIRLCRCGSRRAWFGIRFSH